MKPLVLKSRHSGDRGHTKGGHFNDGQDGEPDDGVVLNFFPKKDSRLLETELAYYAQHDFQPLNERQYNELQRALRKERARDTMTLDLHGYHIRFDRDQQPSWQSAHVSQHHNEYGHHHNAHHFHHQHPVMYEISYLYLMAMAGVLLLCLHGIVCIFGMHSGYDCVRQKYCETSFRPSPNNAQQGDIDI